MLIRVQKAAICNGTKELIETKASTIECNK